MMASEYDAWRQLAAGIVISAVNEWRQSCYNEEWQKRMEERFSRPERSRSHNRPEPREQIEEFFLSDWFKLLCDVDGAWLIRKLREDEQTRGRRRKYRVDTLVT